MKGLELSRRFYQDCVKPILEGDFPEISRNHAAGLIGPSSDVIENDDEYSRDHDWGPRCFLFLTEEDHVKKSATLNNALKNKLPMDFLGFPTRFEYGNIGGIPTRSKAGHHHIGITTPKRFIELSLGRTSVPENDFEWLSISEQRLMEFTRGEIFEDFNGEISNLRKAFSYFPENVWKYRIAFAFESLGWEDDLIFMCGHRGDTISMQINSAKTVERIMRLVFLMNKKYAPLSPKWLQREFRKLPEISNRIEGELIRILENKDYHKKTDALNFIYEIILADMERKNICNGYKRENRKDISGVIWEIQSSAKDVFNTIQGELKNTTIGGLPIGAIDQWMCNEDFIMCAEHMKEILPVYKAKGIQRNRLGDLFMVPPL